MPARAPQQVAERLANEAVNPVRQTQIVAYDGLKLLLPLTQSDDVEIKRLAAHALANLSVNSANQVKMAKEGALQMLIGLLACPNELVQRQSAKGAGRAVAWAAALSRCPLPLPSPLLCFSSP